MIDMKYKVIDTFSIGGNTSVTIEGNGDELCNGLGITDEKGREYRILSVAMVHYENPSDIKKSTALLIEGNFTGKEINAGD